MAKTKKPKATQAEVNQRVKEIADQLLAGFTRSHILQYASNWGVSDRQVDEYIAQATAQIKEINSTTIQDNLALISSNQWDLYRKAIKENNLAVARQVLMDLAKLRGLDQMIVNHIIEDKREHADLSDADLDKALEEAAQAKH